MSTEKPKKSPFIQGQITAEFIGNSIAKHQSKTSIGAHNIFLGQVRADEINGKKVTAIDYSAYEEMAEDSFHTIRESAFEKFELTCMHIYHSLGKVNAGNLPFCLCFCSKTQSGLRSFGIFGRGNQRKSTRFRERNFGRRNLCVERE